VIWTRIVDPRERYRITYRDRDGELTERTIDLLKVGFSPRPGGQGRTDYYGVMDAGRFKTMRVDRVVSVIEQLTTGHASSIRPAPSYSSELPRFPLDNAVYKMPTVAQSNRTWTVDLNRYTCTCPEKRVRAGKGFEPGKLGFVCPHMARAILEHLPSSAAWPPELLNFLADPRKVHIDNLVR